MKSASPSEIELTVVPETELGDTKEAAQLVCGILGFELFGTF